MSRLGDAGEAAILYAQDHALVPKTMALLERPRALGFTAALVTHGEGTGVGAGIAWTPPATGHHLHLEASGSTNEYSRVRIAATGAVLRAEYTNEWRPREPFFGRGGSTPAGARSNFGEHIESARLAAAWTWHEPMREDVAGIPVTPLDRLQGPRERRGTTLAIRAGPEARVVTTGRDPDQPSFERVHPADAAGSLDWPVGHVVYGASVMRDEREGFPHWTHGWRAGLDAERFDRAIRALALAGAGPGARSFTRLAYRAEAGVSFGRDPRTLRLLAEAVDQRLDRTGGALPVAELASLGGPTLEGFMPGRFRDDDLLHARLSYIYPLCRNLEFDLHAETGAVFPALADVHAHDLQGSAGGALRGRTDLNVVGVLGVDRSREQTRFHFAIGRIE